MQLICSLKLPKNDRTAEGCPVPFRPSGGPLGSHAHLKVSRVPKACHTAAPQATPMSCSGRAPCLGDSNQIHHVLLALEDICICSNVVRVTAGRVFINKCSPHSLFLHSQHFINSSDIVAVCHLLSPLPAPLWSEAT